MRQLLGCLRPPACEAASSTCRCTRPDGDLPACWALATPTRSEPPVLYRQRDSNLLSNSRKAYNSSDAITTRPPIRLVNSTFVNRDQSMPWPSNLVFESHGGVNPDQLSDLELKIGVELPQDYRDFLLEMGGGYVDDLIAECVVPTPFGELNIVEFGDLNSIVRLLDSEITPRNMICIAHGHFGMTTCLSIAGLDHGSVYALDTEMRFFWDKAKLEKLPNLDPSRKSHPGPARIRLRPIHRLTRRCDSTWG